MSARVGQMSAVCVTFARLVCRNGSSPHRHEASSPSMWDGTLTSRWPSRRRSGPN